VDDLFSRGGMASLLTTVWLVLAAMAFAAILEHVGFLDRLLRPIVTKARSRGQLILAVIHGSAIGLNVTAGDQYVADVLPARMYAEGFRRRGLAPEVLSGAVEESGTVTSPLVPWNTCGSYMSGVLGVLGFKVATIDEVAARQAQAETPAAAQGSHITNGGSEQ
jgi:NhaC family Na+:H+ antiporter